MLDHVFDLLDFDGPTVDGCIVFNFGHLYAICRRGGKAIQA